ncbi:MAG: hypothetical protein KAU83_10610 [Bacteroidales bacterium]|nr:hypothetical protein [Bacteroidales bacterium]
MTPTKKYSFLFRMLVFLFSVSFIGCQDKVFEQYMMNVPVYMSYEELRSSIKNNTSQELKDPGKIYFKDNYLFINEEYKGIHIIDNSDPSSPQNITFINLPGNVDIAIKGNTLFADSYIDLVAIDISDINNIAEIGRVEDVFSYTLPPVDNNYWFDDIDQSKGVVKDWEVKKVRKEIEPITPYPIFPFWRNSEFTEVNFSSSSARTSGGSQSSFGVGGSMARFVLHKDILYAINESKMKLFNISNPSQPVSNGEFHIRWGMETLFLYMDNLFIGTQTGMLIYDLSNPLSPEKISQYEHIRSCDPVVVEDNTAYVTLRTGTTCGGNTNQLDVIDISNLQSPRLIKSYSMTKPHGLGIDEGILFVCDGDAGLKIYDASNPNLITSNLLSTFTDINAWDLIPFNGILMMIGSDGFYQYNYENIRNITFLSKIPIIQ